MEGKLKDFALKTQEFKEECMDFMRNMLTRNNPPEDKFNPQPAFSITTEDHDNVSTTTSASIIGKEGDIEETNDRKVFAEERQAKLIASDLHELVQLVSKLRLRLSSLHRLDDPLFDIFKFLSRKQLIDSVQLTTHRLHKIITRKDEHWPRFKFGRFILFTDDDLKRTTKYWMLKNRQELKAPPTELAPILGALDARSFDLDSGNKIVNPIQLVCHYSVAANNAPPTGVYFLINLDEKDTDDSNEDEHNFEMLQLAGPNKTSRFFIHLPNKLDTKMAMAATVYWFRQLSKVHFDSVHFEQYRWTRALFDFIADFGISTFLPITADSFKSYNPVSIHFLGNAIRANSLTLWEIRGTNEFLQYLLGDQQRDKDDSRSGKRMPESIRVWGFLPQQISNDSGQSSFFDALIQYAKNCKKPEEMVQRIDLNFKTDPAQWIKIISGIQLIYKCQTFKVDEEDGTENETIEVRYRIRNADGGRKFEIRVECEPDMLDQQMHAFAIILEEEQEKE